MQQLKCVENEDIKTSLNTFSDYTADPRLSA